jgi:hypothetical protein
VDLNEIKSIVNSDLSDEVKKSEVINCLARDENVIPLVMSILESERKQDKKVYSEMNLLLSRAHIGLEDPKFAGTTASDIVEFYLKHRNKKGIGHCHKNIYK